MPHRIKLEVVGSRIRRRACALRRNDGGRVGCAVFTICGLVHARPVITMFPMLKTKSARSIRKESPVRPSADVKKPFWRGHAHPELTRSGDLFLQNLKEIRETARSRGNSV